MGLSRLYKQSIDKQWVTRVHSAAAMERDMFIRREDAHSQGVWRSIEENFASEQAIVFCHAMYPSEEVLVHHKAMSYFVTHNVFLFLFEVFILTRSLMISITLISLSAAVRSENALFRGRPRRLSEAAECAAERHPVDVPANEAGRRERARGAWRI